MKNEKSNLEKIADTISFKDLEDMGYRHELTIHADVEVHSNHDSYVIVRQSPIGDFYSVHNKYYKENMK